MKWEYKSVFQQPDLQDLGSEGWELAAVVPRLDSSLTGKYILYNTWVFKRSVNEESLSVQDSRCCKACGSDNIMVSYHTGYDPYNCRSSYQKTFFTRSDEHLHIFCRTCSYDWCEDALMKVLPS